MGNVLGYVGKYGWYCTCWYPLVISMAISGNSLQRLRTGSHDSLSAMINPYYLNDDLTSLGEILITFRHTHTIPVLNIYQHLPPKWPRFKQIFQHHGASGIPKTYRSTVLPQSNQSSARDLVSPANCHRIPRFTDVHRTIRHGKRGQNTTRAQGWLERMWTWPAMRSTFQKTPVFHDILQEKHDEHEYLLVYSYRL